MTKDNEDALRCADALNQAWHTGVGGQEMLTAEDRLRRLVAENEALRADVDHEDAFATQLGRNLMTAQREIEAKDALLRQAVEIWDSGQSMFTAVAAIRQHLEGKA